MTQGGASSGGMCLGGGADSLGKEYATAEEMWKAELPDGEQGKKPEWYTKGIAYWRAPAASPAAARRAWR